MMVVSPLSISIPAHLMRSAMNKEEFEKLKDSMNRLGMLNPLTVREVDGKYELIAGYRRLKVAKELRWEEVPINEVPATDTEAEAMKVAENVDREDVSPMDEGVYLKKIMDEGNLNQGQMADIIGRSEAYVSKRLGTLKWPEKLKLAVEMKGIAFSGANALMGIKDPEYRMYQIKEAVKFGASLSVIETWVESWNKQTAIEEERNKKGREGIVPGEVIKSTVECGACGQKNAPDGFVHIIVDAVCDLMMKETQFRVMMVSNKEKTIQVVDEQLSDGFPDDDRSLSDLLPKKEGSRGSPAAER